MPVSPFPEAFLKPRELLNYKKLQPRTSPQISSLYLSDSPLLYKCWSCILDQQRGEGYQRDHI